MSDPDTPRTQQSLASSPPAPPAVADPAPLGLAAFAMTTFVLSVINAGLLDPRLGGVALPLAFAYGGLVQLLAGMWEFRRANVFGAVAFSSYGGFWLSFAIYEVFIVGSLPVGGVGAATGLYLLGWAIFTAYMTVAAARVSGGVFGVFVFLTLTFIALMIGDFAGNDMWVRIGGWLGIVTAFIAWYTSFAGIVNSTWKRTVLPTWPVYRA